MKTKESIPLSKDFTILFRDFSEKYELSTKTLQERGALVLLFESIMGLILDVTPEEIKKFKDFLGH